MVPGLSIFSGLLVSCPAPAAGPTSASGPDRTSGSAPTSRPGPSWGARGKKGTGLAAWAFMGLMVMGTLVLLAPRQLDAQSAASQDDRKVVAVLYFDNHTGAERFDPLGKGMAEMLITDLSGIQYLRLVERARLQDLIDEQRLSQSDHSDPDTALEIGRILAAEYVVTGSFTGIEPEIRVDSRLIHTESGEIVQTASASGTEEGFFTIQEELAFSLIQGMEIALTDQETEEYRQHLEGNRINNAESVVAFSRALNHYDRGRYLEAAEDMAFVAREEPGSAIVAITYQHMRDSAQEAAQEEGRSRLGNFLRGIIDGR